MVLHATGFARLLARLDPDTHKAGLEYERLRRSLIRFFDWQGAALPDECADITLDRLAQRLGDVAVADPGKYARAIARLVLLEQGRRPVWVPLEDAARLPASPPADRELELPYACLESCLEAVPQDRGLVSGYYEGSGARRIDRRRRLAESLGVSDAALRSRVHRLRDRLERCVRDCVSERSR